MTSSEPARVRLRPLEDADISAVHRLLSDRRVVQYMLFPVCDLEMARKFVTDSSPVSDPGPGASIVQGIVFADSGILVGLCGLVLDREAAQGEAWYLLDPDYWGKGLTSEAAEQLVALGFGQLRLHRVWATCLPQNPASARVLKKVGMRREGYLRKALRIHDEWHDCFLYALLREEWHVRNH